MHSLTLLSATSAPQSTATFALLIDEKYTNMNNVMHGGAAGVIFDMCTNSALGPIAKPGFWEYVPVFHSLFFRLSRSFNSIWRNLKERWLMERLIWVGKSLIVENSFFGGVTRALNISYLKAVPVGTSFLPYFHISIFLLSSSTKYFRRNDNPHPQRRYPGWPNNGTYPGHHRERRREDYLLHV